MKFKEFVIKSVAKELNMFTTGNVDYSSANEILLEFAVKEFNDKSQLKDKLPAIDYDEEMGKFTDLLADKSKKEKIELLHQIASFVDSLSEQGRYFYIIPIGEIYLTVKGTILFNWFEFSDYCIHDKFIIPKKIRQEYGNLFDRTINSGVISYQLLEPTLSKNAFIKLLMQSIHPKVALENMISIKYWINVAITELGFTPEERAFMVKLITNNQEFTNCQDVVKQYQTALEKSIIYLPKSINKQKWSSGFHTEQGRNKRSTQNEDSYEILQTADAESLLFMVADGVSTANIGRGKVVSSRIQEYIADKENDVLPFLNNIAQLSHQEWVVAAKKKISSILTDLNGNLTAELGIRFRDVPQPELEHQPMSSTVILGMINNNRCVFGYLGDSHVFYLANKGTLLKLTEDQNVLYERVIEYLNQDNKQPFTTTKGDSHLTKTIPAIEYNKDENSYQDGEIANELAFFTFYPEANCSIIVSTDGLLDSIGTTSNEIISEQELLKVLEENKSKYKDNRDLAREVGRYADTNSGIDNITLLIFTNEAKPQQETLPNDKK